MAKLFGSPLYGVAARSDGRYYDQMTDARPLLEIWRLRSLRASRAHYHAATLYQRRDSLLTGFNVTASITVAALGSAFWVIEAKINSLNILISIAAIFSVIVAVIQYALDYRGKSNIHQSAAAQYAMTSRAIEAALISEDKKDIEKFRNDLDALGQGSPVLPASIWEKEIEITKKIKNAEPALFEVNLQIDKAQH